MTIHKESQETFDFIAQWIHPELFFSKNDRWDRFGFLGIFGDYVLSCTQGDILEIGTGESSIYLSHLARKFNRFIYHCDISPGKIDNPLTVKGYFACENALFWKDSSDALFAKVNINPLALCFIDGDHNYGQAKKDFDNAVKYIVDNGYIILHDSYPPDESYVSEHRCGTVYQLRQDIEQDKRFDILTLTRTAGMGVGLSLVRKKPENRAYYNE